MGIFDKFIPRKPKTEEDGEFLFKGGKIAGSESKPQRNAEILTTNPKDELSTSVEEEPKQAVVVKLIPGTVKQVNKKLLDGWEQWLTVEKNRAITTRREYLGDIRMFAEFLVSHRGGSLKSAGVEDMREFVRTIRGKGCGPAIVNRRLAALRTFYAWAMREGYVKLNPASSEFVDRFKIPGRLPIHLTEAQHQDLMRALERYDPKKRTFIAFMNLGGLRISEVCSLKAEHLVSDGDTIIALRVIGKGDKERVVPVHPVLSNYTDQYLVGVPKTGYLFPGRQGTHIHRMTGWRWFREFKAKVGFNGKLTPHKLRHTFATRLYQKGAPIFDLQKMLGHADPRTTGIYAHVDYEALRSHIQKLL